MRQQLVRGWGRKRTEAKSLPAQLARGDLDLPLPQGSDLILGASRVLDEFGRKARAGDAHHRQAREVPDQQLVLERCLVGDDQPTTRSQRLTSSNSPNVAAN